MLFRCNAHLACMETCWHFGGFWMQRRSGEKKKMSRSKCFSNGYRFNSMVWREEWEIIIFFSVPISFSEHEKEIQKHITVLLCFASLQFSCLALAFSFPPTSISTSKIQGRCGQNCWQFSLDKTFLGSSKKEQITIRFLNTQGKINREIICPAMLVLEILSKNWAVSREIENMIHSFSWNCFYPLKFPT